MVGAVKVEAWSCIAFSSLVENQIIRGGGIGGDGSISGFDL